METGKGHQKHCALNINLKVAGACALMNNS